MANLNNPVANEDNIAPKELFFFLLYQWHIILPCTLLMIIFALFYIKSTPNVYSVDAKIQMIDNKPTGLAGLSPQLASLGSLAGINLGGGQQSIQTEIEVIKSRTILGQTIAELNLDLSLSPKQSLWQKVTSTRLFSLDYSPEQVQVHHRDRIFTIRHFEVPTAYLNQNLTLSFQGQSFVLTSNQTGQDILKGTLNHTQKSMGWHILIESKTPLQGQYTIQKQTLSTAFNSLSLDLNVAELSKQAGIIQISYHGTDKQHLMKVLNHIVQTYQAQSLSTKAKEKEKSLIFLNQQLPQVKQDLEQAERQFNTFRKNNGMIDVQQESTLYLKQSVELETQKIQLEQKLAQLTAQYTDQHPLIKEIYAQISTLDHKIHQLNGTLKNLPNLQSEYLQYYRDVQIKTQLYTSLLGSYQSLSLAQAGELDSTRILDYPIEPAKPIKPRKLIILILAMLVGGFIGVFISLLRMVSQSGVHHREEIRTLTDLTTYVELVQQKKSLWHKQRQVDYNATKLATFIPTLLFKLTDKAHPTILISSITANTQQSHIAKQLALALSKTNKRILLIDTDLHTGTIAQVFTRNPSPGLAEYLLGKTTLEQTIQTIADTSLSVLPCGQLTADSAWLGHTEKFHQLIPQLQEQYDYIILSAAPILSCPDSLTLAKYSDFNLALVQYGKTTSQDIVLAKSQFEQTGLKLDGVVLHDIPMYQM